MYKQFRCALCNRLLARVTINSQVEIKCPKCKTINDWQETEEGIIQNFRILKDSEKAKLKGKGISEKDIILARRALRDSEKYKEVRV